jgi:hypothetical protein
MSFELGHKKFGGRKAGKPNKSTREFRNLLGAFVEKELELLPQTFNTIKSPEKRVELILKLLPFVLPKAQEISLEMLSDRSLEKAI